MLTIVTPATATDLISIERARALLDFPSSEFEAVEILIKQASRAIVDHCRRPFGIETVRETFDEPARNGGVLLRRSAVIEIMEVKQGTTVIMAANYRHDFETGYLFQLGDDGWRLCWTGCLTVTYRAGYILPSDEDDAPEPTLPPAVERAAIRLVGAYLSMKGRDSLIKSEMTEGVGSTSWWVPNGSSAFPDPEVEQLLAPYRRLF